MPDNKPEDSNGAPLAPQKDFERATRRAVTGSTLEMMVLGTVMGPLGWGMLTYTRLACAFFPYMAFGDNWFSDLIGPEDLSMSRVELIVSAAVGGVFGAAAGLDRGLKAREDILRARDRDGSAPRP